MSNSVEIFNNEISMFTIRGELGGSPESTEFSAVRQFIGLMIDREEFLLPIEVTNEIIMMHQLTFVPRAPRFIEGVINLRGTILPAINLRKMLGVPTTQFNGQSRIIIARCENVTVGLIVDGITYVVALNHDQIQVQSLHNKSGSELISMISKRGDQVNGILDIAKILGETGISYHEEEVEEA
ncbi:MAG: chemotaxis protein CheW [Chitinophagaceae bacterium]|nr:chemotaxis protein CheW [Oligoflexus sp.]